LFEIGLMIGAYSVTMLCLEIPTGGLADAIGRKRVAVLSFFFLIAGSVVFIFAFSFIAFVFSCILTGTGRALFSGSLDAWFIDSLQEADPGVNLQPALAKADTFTLFALGTGTLSGSAIPYLFGGLPQDGTDVFTPLAMPLVFAIGFKVIMLILTLVMVGEQNPPLNLKNVKKGIGDVPKLIRTGIDISRRNTVILMLFVIMLLSMLVLVSIEIFWQPQFANLFGGVEGNSIFFGLALGGSFFVAMAGNLLSIPLCKKFNQRFGLVSAIFQGMYAVFLLLLALQTSAFIAIIIFWLVYFNMGIVNSPHATLLNNEIPSKHRSSMLSINSFIGSIGAIIGTVVLSFIAEQGSISLSWLIGGAVLIVTVFIYLRIDFIKKGDVKKKSVKNKN